MLDHIRIVLSHPTHAGNVGGAARAMKNMGLTHLHLIAPTPDYQGDVARARSAGAEDVLEQARVWPDIDTALADCALVIGTTARERAIAWPALSVRDAVQALLSAAPGSAALLFGQERSGLTNDELDRCTFVVTIPSDPKFASLNLASAVQIMAYELYRAISEPAEKDAPVRASEPLATDAELQALYQHLEQVLIEIAFLDPANPRKLMRRLMRLFNRARLDKNEMNILRGILTAVQQRRPPANT